MLAYNIYNTTILDNLSPFEVVAGRTAKIIPKLKVTPYIYISGTFKDAYTLLQRKLKYFRENLQKFRDKYNEFLNR